MSQPFPLGVVTDEIDQDVERACRVAAELGMGIVELNNLWAKPADRLGPGEVARVRATVRRYGLRVDAVGTLAFKALELSKHPILGESEEYAEHLDAIRRATAIARELADVSLAPTVRIFSFRREPMEGLGNPSPILPDGGGLPDAVLRRIVDGLGPACDLAREHGVRLLVENVRSCWGNTGVHTARIVEAAGRPELGIIWDVANDYVSCGQGYRAGYLATKAWTAAVHCKDARVVDWSTGLTAWTAIGDGEVDVAGQLAELARDGFGGPVVLETHWRGHGLSKEASSRHSFAGLRAALARVASAPAQPPR